MKRMSFLILLALGAAGAGLAQTPLVEGSAEVYSVGVQTLRVVKNPLNQTFFEGTSLILFIEAEGGHVPLTYQWFKDGSEPDNAIAGATLNQYVKPGAVVADSGAYWCQVTDSIGETASSAAATVTVRPIGAPWPEWKFTHAAGASTTTVVINWHSVSVFSQVLTALPPTFEVRKILAIFKDAVGEHVIRVDVTGNPIPLDGDSVAFTIDGAAAVDWWDNPFPIDLSVSPLQAILAYSNDGIPPPLKEPRVDRNKVTGFCNGTQWDEYQGNYYTVKGW